MERPFVTIVVPTRNRARLLGDALASLLVQDYPRDRYEIVVVDDGSTDGTAEVVLRSAKRAGPPKVGLIRQPHRAVDAARNRGVAAAAGSLIAFLDDDEVAPTGWLSTLIHAAHRYPEADCFGGPYRLRFEGRTPRLCSACVPLEGAVDRGEEERLVDWVDGGNMMIRPRAFEHVGGFDESMLHYGAIEWMDRFVRAGGRIVYLPDAWIVHRRTTEMLRLRNRLRRAFANGRGEVGFRLRTGRDTEGLRRLSWAPRRLAHAVRRPCSGGLVQVANLLGHATESARVRISPRA
jgi:glycosyltransferase involved in cell wall biosynthesis